MQDMCRKESTMEETYMEMLTRRAKSAATEAAKLGTEEEKQRASFSGKRTDLAAGCNPCRK